jgi:hypothetical protein
MTRKDYKLIAAALNKSYHLLRGTVEERDVAHMWRIDRENIADALYEASRYIDRNGNTCFRFNREKFMHATTEPES